MIALQYFRSETAEEFQWNFLMQPFQWTLYACLRFYMTDSKPDISHPWEHRHIEKSLTIKATLLCHTPIHCSMDKIRRHYSDNGVRGHEYIWTSKHTESGLVFLVWSKLQWSNYINTTRVNIIKIITYDSCKQILNSMHVIELNVRSKTPNRQFIVYIWLYIGFIYVEK